MQFSGCPKKYEENHTICQALKTRAAVAYQDHIRNYEIDDCGKQTSSGLYSLKVASSMTRYIDVKQEEKKLDWPRRLLPVKRQLLEYKMRYSRMNLWWK